MTKYNIIAATNESTVVSEYTPEKRNATHFQSEYELEKEFIKRLGQQGFDFIEIKNEEALVENLRKQIERLNNYTFTDGEWKRFFDGVISNQNEKIVDKTRKIQTGEYVQVLKRDNGTSKNIKLIEKDNIHNNSVQVINQ